MAIHKIVDIRVTTITPGLKDAVRSTDGATEHTVRAFVRVDRKGTPTAVCNKTDYEGFVRSFGIEDVQYGVYIEKGHFIFHVYIDEGNQMILPLGRDELNSEEQPMIISLKGFNRPAHYTFKVYSEKHAGARVDEFACTCREHTQAYLKLE